MKNYLPDPVPANKNLFAGTPSVCSLNIFHLRTGFSGQKKLLLVMLVSQFGWYNTLFQTLLFTAARSVTGLSGFTSTKKLMEKRGWLTMKQLGQYHTIIMVHKTLLTWPLHMYNRFYTDYNYRTRQHSTGCIRLDHTYMCRTELPKNSFRYRGAHHYNALPAQIRTVRNMETFKLKLKRWIKINIEPD